MRIDKYLSTLELFSRKRSAPVIKKGGFSVNGEPVFDKKHFLNEGDILSRDDTTHGPIKIVVKTRLTLLINKPAGYISSDIDEGGHPSYKQLLIGTDFEWYLPILHIAGRLDVDTEGLIMVTSDGKFNHRITSPKHHQPKVYIVTCRDDMSAKECTYLAKGVILEDGYKTKPAKVEQLENNVIKLTITEGKYHQVKRMLISLGNEVVHLERIAIGPWTIDDLPSGKAIELPKQAIQDALGWKIG